MKQRKKLCVNLVLVHTCRIIVVYSSYQFIWLHPNKNLNGTSHQQCINFLNVNPKAKSPDLLPDFLVLASWPLHGLKQDKSTKKPSRGSGTLS